MRGLDVKMLYDSIKVMSRPKVFKSPSKHSVILDSDTRAIIEDVCGRYLWAINMGLQGGTRLT